MNKPTTAILLAADKAPSLKAITDFTPRPLIRIAGRSLLKRALDRLCEEGIEKAIVVINKESQKIVQRLSKYENHIDINIETEENPVNSLISARQALPYLNDDAPLWLVNTDILWLYSRESSLSRLCRLYKSHKMDAMLLMHESAEAWGDVASGDFYMNSRGLLSQKPERQVSPWVFTGVQLLKPSVLDQGDADMHSLWNRLIENERLYGALHDGQWFHVDNSDSLKLASAYMDTRYAYMPRRF